MTDLPKIPQFDKLRWQHLAGDDQWRLRDDDDLTLVGEVYYQLGRGWRWHCKTSDWRESGVGTAEEAKTRCLVSHVKDAMLKYAEDRAAALSQVVFKAAANARNGGVTVAFCVKDGLAYVSIPGTEQAIVQEGRGMAFDFEAVSPTGGGVAITYSGRRI